MDKLKQVLKYQFWILLGLAVLFPLIGWFLASSGMAKNFDERQKKLDGQFSQLKASAADPNSDWESQLKKINEVQELESLKAQVQLWEMQQPLKVWPPKMSTTDPEQFTSADRGYYRKNYLSFRKEVYDQLEPVVEDEEEGRRRGKVAIALDSFPISEAVGGVRTDNPSSQEIEEAQEDLWLANAIIQVVRSLNQSSSSQVDAVIPEITVFNLRGGNRSGSTITLTKKSGGSSASSTSASAGGGGAAAMGEQMAKMAKEGLKASGFGGGMGGGGMGGGGASGDASTVGTVPAVTFDPIEELGEPGENPARRYVEDRDEFRTRGFYLELKIDQTRVPELLVLLSNLSWPARVTRVHVADVREEDLLPLGSSGGAAGSLAAGGGAMGGGMGMMSGGGGIDAMKAMSGAMAKMGGGGGGGGVSGQAAGALLGGRVPGAPASGGGATAGLTGGGLGGLTGGAGAEAAATPKVDPLANPNLVNVALDGWFTLYKKPKPEVLAKVYPPAKTDPATSPGAAVPADGTTVPAGAAAGAAGADPAAGPGAGGVPANAATISGTDNADGSVAGSPEPTAGAAATDPPATDAAAGSPAESPAATNTNPQAPTTDAPAAEGAPEPATPPAENPPADAPPAGTAPQ
ncbi:MAG: hypothetical protein ACK6D3_03260 [Planctomycetaceae bacterium]|jgi:hypothetical protein